MKKFSINRAIENTKRASKSAPILSSGEQRKLSKVYQEIEEASSQGHDRVYVLFWSERTAHRVKRQLEQDGYLVTLEGSNLSVIWGIYLGDPFSELNKEEVTNER